MLIDLVSRHNPVLITEHVMLDEFSINCVTHNANQLTSKEIVLVMTKANSILFQFENL